MKFNWTVRMDIGFEPFDSAETQKKVMTELRSRIWPQASVDAWKEVKIAGVTEAEARAKLNDLLLHDQTLCLSKCISDRKIKKAKSIEDPIPAGVVWRPIGNLHLSNPGGGRSIEYMPEDGSGKTEFFFVVDGLNVTCLMAFQISTEPVEDADSMEPCT